MVEGVEVDGGSWEGDGSGLQRQCQLEEGVKERIHLYVLTEKRRWRRLFQELLYSRELSIFGCVQDSCKHQLLLTS